MSSTRRLAMTALARLLATSVIVLATLAAQTQSSQPQSSPDPSGSLRFTTVDVFVDSGRVPLAAWQLEIRALSPGVRTVGVEGGEHQAFRDAPWYDPKAMQSERIVLAAFDTGRALPSGSTRVARLHLAVEGSEEPELSITLQASATLDGAPVEAAARFVR